VLCLRRSPRPHSYPQLETQGHLSQAQKSVLRPDGDIPSCKSASNHQDGSQARNAQLISVVQHWRATEPGAQLLVFPELSLTGYEPDSANAHFALAYVLRYAGLLDESANECDAALALDRSNFRFRSCSIVFAQLGRPQRAMEFARLDAGSEFSARQTALILLGEGKVDDARQTIQRASDAPQMGRDLLQVCLNPKQASQLDRTAQRTEAASVAEGDVEGWYIIGTMLSYCGQKNAAVRLLRRAVGQNYCAYDALHTDPLLAKLRRSPEVSGLLSAAKECQNRFLAQRDPH
jgi:tetratricopeptide (TPR) repeat protein